MHADLIRDSAALYERVLILIKLGAKFIDALMFIEDLKFLKVFVTLLEFNALLRVLLNESLALPLHLNVHLTRFFRLS